MDQHFRKYLLSISSWSAFLIAFAALNLSVWARNAELGYSGVFGGLTVGVDTRHQTLSGFYSEGSGWDETTKAPTFTCTFYLRGTFQGDRYNITTWYPGESETINGQIVFAMVDGHRKIKLRLEREHGGCGNVHPFATEDGEMLAETQRGSWFAVRVVCAARAYFYSRPSLEAKKEQYIVRYSPIRVLKTEDHWVAAEFEAEKTTRGWIKASDLFSCEPKE